MPSPLEIICWQNCRGPKTCGPFTSLLQSSHSSFDAARLRRPEAPKGWPQAENYRFPLWDRTSGFSSWTGLPSKKLRMFSMASW